MKTLFRGMVAVLASLFLLSVSATAQERETITDGREYMIAFPQVTASPSEKPLPNPMQILVGGRYDNTKVTITTPSVINGNAPINRVYTVNKDEVIRIPVSTTYMADEPGRIEGIGISVIGDKPIAVYTYQAWLGNGELARHLPVQAWHRDYYTMNFYLDRYGHDTYRASQFVIIAVDDNTVVTITPPYPTAGGPDLPSIPINGSGTITLDRGETFLLTGMVNQFDLKEFTSDLSGTRIRSNSPIGVISGHQKVGIMRYPDVLPPTGIFAAEAHFVRNNVHDAMLPTYMGGTEFVVSPSLYTPTRLTGNASPEFGIDDDKGDVVRFVALEDNTTVSKLRNDGTPANLRRINRGETFLETAVEENTVYISDKPILVGQYGKSWAKIIPPGGVPVKGVGNTQGHPTVQSGMPMLQYVPPIDRWVDYAIFDTPEGMDNFINIVFRTSEVVNIDIDGAPILSKIGGAMREIVGTPYSVMRSPIGVGTHVISSAEDGVTWMAWTYGSLDGLQQGRAYGTPVGIDVAVKECDDTLFVELDTVCGDAIGFINVIADRYDCVYRGLFDVFIYDDENYELVIDLDVDASPENLRIPFSLIVTDKNKPAKCTLKIITKSGLVYEQEFRYQQNAILVDPTHIDFGTIPINQVACDTFKITNQGSKEVYIGAIRPRTYTQYFTITPQNAVILPGESAVFEICANIDTYGEIIDTLAFMYAHKLSNKECYRIYPVSFRVRVDEPDFYAEDINYGIIGKNQTRTKTLHLINLGNADVTVTGYNPVMNGPNFLNVQVDLPVTIARGQRIPVQVDYTPNGVPYVRHTDTIWWESNATKTKLYSELTGIGLDAQLIGEGYTWVERVIDEWQQQSGIDRYDGTIYVSNDGNAAVTIINVELTGPDASYFELGPVFVTENGSLNNPVAVGTTNRPITVHFTPSEVVGTRDAERKYYADVVFTYTVASDTIQTHIPLEGTGLQPRLSATGYDYGTVEVNSINTGIINVYNIDPELIAQLNGTKDGTMDLTLFELRIPDNTPFYFKSNGAKVLNFGNGVVISSTGGEPHFEEVIFQPTDVGIWSVPYEIYYNGHMIARPLLVGTAVSTLKLSVTGDSVVYWYNNDTTAIVNVVSSRDGFLTVEEPFGPDANNFIITGWSSDALAFNPNYNLIPVFAGVPITVHLRFTPSAVTAGGLKVGQNLNGRLPYRVRPFECYVRVTDLVSGITDTARVIGDGKYLETTVYIPRDITATVGEVVDVYSYLREVPESVNFGGIYQFRLRFAFNGDLLAPIEAIQEGTQTDGWEIVNLVILNRSTIEIDVKNTSDDGQTLEQSDVPVIGFRYQVMLDNIPSAELPIQLYWLDVETTFEEDKQFVVFNYEPGLITIDLTCAGTLRLVSIGDANYFIHTNGPVVTNNLEINYGVGINAPVEIMMVDLLGKPYDVVRGRQVRGEYHINVNTSTLPSGVYFIIYKSGDYISEPIKVIKQN